MLKRLRALARWNRKRLERLRARQRDLFPLARNERGIIFIWIAIATSLSVWLAISLDLLIVGIITSLIAMLIGSSTKSGANGPSSRMVYCMGKNNMPITDPGMGKLCCAADQTPKDPYPPTCPQAPARARADIARQASGNVKRADKALDAAKKLHTQSQVAKAGGEPAGLDPKRSAVTAGATTATQRDVHRPDTTARGDDGSVIRTGQAPGLAAKGSLASDAGFERDREDLFAYLRGTGQQPVSEPTSTPTLAAGDKKSTYKKSSGKRKRLRRRYTGGDYTFEEVEEDEDVTDEEEGEVGPTGTDGDDEDDAAQADDDSYFSKIPIDENLFEVVSRRYVVKEPELAP